MKVSLKWLNEFVDLSDVDAHEVADQLTSAGVEVGEISKFKDPKIVVGRIVEIQEIPKAKSVVLCLVDVGDGTIRNIACGAKNMKAGDFVPTALPGAAPVALPFEISERKVAGVMSQGMLCAKEELGLAEKSEGLWILPEGLELGTPVYEAMGLDGATLELDLTPNRPDCLSHRGVGIELGALLGKPVCGIKSDAHTGTGGPLSDVASLDVQDPGCPRYAMAVMEDIAVGPSPDWLQARLASIGSRSINNIVDVTNYVLMHVGQPLHAFDLDKLDGGITVRRGRDGETMVGIDHKEYKVDGRDLVIADDTGPVAIAGVMGGERTEVTESTTRILIECAYFEPTLVRKTSKRLGLHTDSSHRFERGIDPNAIAENLELAIDLVMRVHEGSTPSLRTGRIDHYPKPIEPVTVELPLSLPKRILGIDLSVDQIEGYLTSLGLDVSRGAAALNVVVPTRRPDIERPIDLVEEIVRLYGLDNLEPSFPEVSIGHVHQPRVEAGHEPTIVPRDITNQKRRIRDVLLAEGLYQAVNFSFTSEAELHALKLTEDDARRFAHPIANPVTSEMTHMRTTLVSGLLRNLETNVAQRTFDVGLFEIGRVYLQDGEQERLGLLVTGQRASHFAATEAWSFYDVKGLVESLAVPFDTADATWSVPAKLEPYLHPGVQANWSVGDTWLATVGQVHPAMVKELDLGAPVVLLELNLDGLFKLGQRQAKHAAISKFPSVKRDFALLYDVTANYSDLRSSIDKLAKNDGKFGRLLENVELFDVYEGEQVPEGKRSLALSVTYRSDDKTLTDDEIKTADAKLLAWLEKSVGTVQR